MSASLTEKSKYLSYLLRHKPEAANLDLDKEGWCAVGQILTNTNITLDELKTIVAEDSKGRYSFTGEHGFVRANQGHSTKGVKLTFAKAVPPAVLYHGTYDTVVETILNEGLKPMSRHHVHLTDDIETARSVGGRRRKGVTIFKIDAKRMLADGVQFFRSENDVWLVDAVPPHCLSFEE